MPDLPDEYLKALGPELGAIYQKLSDDVSWLHFKWKQYRILFAESPERIDLLNGVAGTFFFTIQEVLHDDVLIHIARLTDRKDHGPGKENLSLLQLASAVKQTRRRSLLKSIIWLRKRRRRPASSKIGGITGSPIQI